MFNADARPGQLMRRLYSQEEACEDGNDHGQHADHLAIVTAESASYDSTDGHSIAGSNDPPASTALALPSDARQVMLYITNWDLLFSRRDPAELEEAVTKLVIKLIEQHGSIQKAQAT